MYKLSCLLIVLLSTYSSIPASRQEPVHVTSSKEEPGNKEEPGPVLIEGLYSNYDYAYSVVIPKGLVGCRDSAPSPNHGFGIDLTGGKCDWMKAAKNDVYPGSYLYLDASYNSFEWKSPDDALEAHITDLKDSGAKNFSSEPRTREQLSALPAARSLLRYEISGEMMVEDITIAFRREKDTTIVYTIDMTTPAHRYDTDKNILTEMIKTWSLQSLPSDYALYSVQTAPFRLPCCGMILVSGATTPARARPALEPPLRLSRNTLSLRPRCESSRYSASCS